MRDIGHIYFIQASGTNRYKIGLTTRPIEDRMKELNSKQSAYPLVLIASVQVANVKVVEKELHKAFSAYRVHGEWFELMSNEVQLVRNALTRLQQIERHDSRDTVIKRYSGNSQHLQLTMPGKAWLMPLGIALVIMVLFRQCEFFQPVKPIEQHQHIHKFKH